MAQVFSAQTLTRVLIKFFISEPTLKHLAEPHWVNVRKISIEGNLNKDNQGPEQEALSILAIDSVEENAGWIRNPWFGRYKNFNNGWIYHFDHGWLYLSSDDFNGIWAWSESRGWVWSKKDYTLSLPINLGNWIYFTYQPKRRSSLLQLLDQSI